MLLEFLFYILMAIFGVTIAVMMDTRKYIANNTFNIKIWWLGNRVRIIFAGIFIFIIASVIHINPDITELLQLYVLEFTGPSGNILFGF